MDRIQLVTNVPSRIVGFTLISLLATACSGLPPVEAKRVDSGFRADTGEGLVESADGGDSDTAPPAPALQLVVPSNRIVARSKVLSSVPLRVVRTGSVRGLVGLRVTGSPASMRVTAQPIPESLDQIDVQFDLRETSPGTYTLGFRTYQLDGAAAHDTDVTVLVRGRSGELDLSFGGGHLTFAPRQSTLNVRGIQVPAIDDGGVLLVEETTATQQQPIASLSVSRLSAVGILDTSFGVHGVLTGRVPGAQSIGAAWTSDSATFALSFSATSAGPQNNILQIDANEDVTVTASVTDLNATLLRTSSGFVVSSLAGLTWLDEAGARDGAVGVDGFVGRLPRRSSLSWIDSLDRVVDIYECSSPEETCLTRTGRRGLDVTFGQNGTARLPFAVAAGDILADGTLLLLTRRTATTPSRTIRVEPDGQVSDTYRAESSNANLEPIAFAAVNDGSSVAIMYTPTHAFLIGRDSSGAGVYQETIPAASARLVVDARRGVVWVAGVEGSSYFVERRWL